MLCPLRGLRRYMWLAWLADSEPAALQALEYQMQQGIADGTRHDFYLVPASAQHEYGAELHSECCAIKLLA